MRAFAFLRSVNFEVGKEEFAYIKPSPPPLPLSGKRYLALPDRFVLGGELGIELTVDVAQVRFSPLKESFELVYSTCHLTKLARKKSKRRAYRVR